MLRSLTLEHLAGAGAIDLDRLIGFPDSMIARVVPVAEDPLLLLAEEYSEWTADAKAFIGRPPELMGLEPVPNQEARLRRKLFIHNTGHYCCALWALARGYRYVHEGGRDPEILAEVSATIAESGAAISAEYGFSLEDIAAYRQNLLDRLACDVFVDSVTRVCREPLRKLGEHERLVGPLNLCIKHGLPYEHLARSIALVMRTDLFGDEQYRQMHAMLAAGGPERILTDVCHLGPGHPARTFILKELDSPGFPCRQ
ncbi:hypothetical protein [Syntrophothermus sp.]|uniref:mannitol dehydrogenase family protein n=1 Tax=Syntrophothermus sp. TaxID=2736299 RepID=UPI00257E2BF8|nr:hypothetical protein [Syntrophothermus sp.]